MIYIALLALLSSPNLFTMNQCMIDHVKDCLSTAHKKNNSCYIQQLPMEVIQDHIIRLLSLADQAALHGTCKKFLKIPFYITQLHPRVVDKGESFNKSAILKSISGLLMAGIGCYHYMQSYGFPCEPFYKEFFNKLIDSSLLVVGSGLLINEVFCYYTEMESLELRKKQARFDRLNSSAMTLYKTVANRLRLGLITGVNELCIDFYTPEQAALLLNVVKESKIPSVSIYVHNTTRHPLKLCSIIANNTALRALKIVEKAEHGVNVNMNNFVKGILHNNHLVELRLEDCDDGGLLQLISIINVKSNIKKFALLRCECDHVILAELARNTTLEELALNCVGSSIRSDNGVRNFLHLMKRNGRLQVLDVSGNNFTQEAKDILNSSLYKPDKLFVD